MAFAIKTFCPRCRRLRMFSPRTDDSHKWKTRCFFCNTSFKVSESGVPSPDNTILEKIGNRFRPAAEF